MCFFAGHPLRSVGLPLADGRQASPMTETSNAATRKKTPFHVAQFRKRTTSALGFFRLTHPGVTESCLDLRNLNGTLFILS